MTENVKAADVDRVAELAHLKLSPDEARSMLHDLNAILDYVAQLNELDTSFVEPLSQVIELGSTRGSTSLREDHRKPSLDRGEVMMQAPEANQAFFKVPKVIER
jgi:aspartyl-tRNA(Asn)/glutamyl-tRNA(Gln) amidotransferase subunit C